MPHNNAGDTVLTKYEKGTPQNPHNTASGNNLFGIASQTAMQNGQPAIKTVQRNVQQFLHTVTILFYVRQKLQSLQNCNIKFKH